MHRWRRALSLLLMLAMLLSTAVGAAEADTIDEILLPEEAEPASIR